MVVPRGEGLRERGFLEGEGGVHRADAACELGREEARVRAGSERGGEEASKEGVMRGVGKAARGMTLLPTARTQVWLEGFQLAIAPGLLSGVEAQSVQR